MSVRPTISVERPLIWTPPWVVSLHGYGLHIDTFTDLAGALRHAGRLVKHTGAAIYMDAGGPRCHLPRESETTR